MEGRAEITVLPPPPPPDLTGTYFLENLAGTSTGGVLLTRPTVSGTLELAQEAPSGDSATGSYEVNIMAPALTIADEGTFTVCTDGSWRQTGEVSGEGMYAIPGDTLTLAIAEPETASSRTVWVMGAPPPPPARAGMGEPLAGARGAPLFFGGLFFMRIGPSGPSREALRGLTE
ncbi:hypothetical protein [Candidatus Palauibacter sp.]|uniref:hypothetical protein n=1 Tax=Candidatus Palauibacter sp. TaxID=3101350 RepID=UPI003D0E963B